MRTLTRTVVCPMCARMATLTLYVRRDPVTGRERHDLELACPGSCEVSETELVGIWAMSHL
jgi:hypothetical protein